MNTPKLFFALDVAGLDDALAIVERIDRPGKIAIKIAPTLYLQRGGIEFVDKITAMGYEVFLDPKFHDIPEQVYGSAKSAAALGILCFTVHVAGGRKMLEAAVKGAKEGAPAGSTPPLVLGVTELTSMEMKDLAEIGVDVPSVEELVVKRAKLAYETGCDGVIASPKEVAAIRAEIPDMNFRVYTPGVRPHGADLHDQKRTGTAYSSVFGGSNGVVVGRPIKDAAEPGIIVDQINAEMSQAVIDRAA